MISRQGRNEMSSSRVKKLRRNMRENGYDQTKPVEVADVDGKMIILDGHHRTQGAIGAGIKEIPENITKATREQGDQLLKEAAEARLY
nr:ParB/RepB/Spo0J family partition protein [Ketobacter sp. MCCC 1A13808]